MPNSIDTKTLEISSGTAAVNLVPSLNANKLLAFEAPENKAMLEFLAKDFSGFELSGKQIAIVSTDGVEEIELIATYQAFEKMGAQVDLVSPRSQGFPQFGIDMPVSRETHILTIRFLENAGWFPVDKWIDEVSADDYDAVVVPGGAWNPDLLRMNEAVLDFIRAMDKQRKIVGAICHGPQVLISAGLVSGRRATIWWGAMVDLTNAGATVTDEPVVVDDRLITSRGPLDIPHFVEAIAGKLKI